MYITTNELSVRTSLSKATIWRYRKKFPDFPKPIKIGELTRWVSHEIDEWLLKHRQNGGEV